MSHYSEHDGEPVEGLPAPLPEGEQMLWQGAPEFKGLALNVFHARKVAIYFALLAIWRVVSTTQSGQTLSAALFGATTLLIVGVLAVGLLVLFAWLTARTSMYTLTDKRVVLRIGIALPMTINLPLSIMDEATLKRYKRGRGDIYLTPEKGQRASFIVLWPHVRPFSLGQPQPAMRALADPDHVADKLAVALGAPGQLPSSQSNAPEHHGTAIASQ